MITIQALHVLLNLKKLAANTNEEMALLGDAPEICLVYDYQQTYNCQKYAGELSAIIHSLVDEKYLMYTRDTEYYFALTAKGIHPLQGIVSAIISFLFRSIAVPIITSIITTMIGLKLFGVI